MLNYWKQVPHVLKYFRGEENPNARLPKNFIDGFLEVTSLIPPNSSPQANLFSRDGTECLFFFHSFVHIPMQETSPQTPVFFPLPWRQYSCFLSSIPIFFVKFGALLDECIRYHITQSNQVNETLVECFTSCALYFNLLVLACYMWCSWEDELYVWIRMFISSSEGWGIE